jgi:predicted dehydrogenase
MARTKATRAYADYREMLEKERPQLVSVALRSSDEHHTMAMAALRGGAHVYIEKPITQTLIEADELLATAQKSGLKIAVPHQMRLAPNIVLLKQRLPDIMGEMLEMRACGKQDARAGGEDLVVLGVHLFDLMRLFAGEPRWCAARILQKGHEITRADAHSASEAIGPIVGDDVMAQFEFGNGIQGSFSSRPKNESASGPYGIELIGSKNSVRILAEIVPKIYVKFSSGWTAKGNSSEWKVWEQDPTLGFDSSERSVSKANQHVVNDWLDAIARNREPICSGEGATKALEMVMAVFSAGLTRGRVVLPLQQRDHPLAPR